VTKCLQCQSERVTKGRIVEERNAGAAQFRPDSLRSWALTLQQGPHLDPEAHACLDCGLVWSTTDKAELASFMRKHCDS
jgi:hypothetical protein